MRITFMNNKMSKNKLIKKTRGKQKWYFLARTIRAQAWIEVMVFNLKF